ncbi:MAG: protein kinase, partial [Gemmatimonadales bacterium]
MTELLDRLRAALADRYTVERELGRGGMATVYLARDLKHGRPVAVKVLLPELTAALGGERFLQEIRVTASLQHPHILALYDSGEADGLLYYVMPFVDGESLRDRLRSERQLPVEEALRVTQQVASALGFAHRHDVIHRDIKPENILLHEGVAMVADFGIALAVKAAGGERLTETGLSIGTPEYMSPEQVAGDRAIDARSDVYASACVLYEMLAGQPPFTAATGQAVLARHVTDPVPAITTVRPGLSRAIAAAITKALAKAPADRFESAEAFAEALFLKEPEADQDIKSIVVLPFENLSPDPDNAFFADGLTEEVIADLSKIRALTVISRTSAMMYKGANKSAPAIAEELNVRYVLEGSVRRAGPNLRITAQLIDAQTDAHLWAEKYGGTLDDVFDLQERLSREIVEELQVSLTADEDRRLAARPIGSAAAYDCYLRAIESMWQLTEGALARAVEHLERGLDIEGESALLRGALAYVYYQHANIGLEPTEQFRRQAREHADRALALDPEAPLGHLAIGLLSAFQNPAEGIRSFRRVLRADPNHVEARFWLAIIMSGWRPDVARTHLQAARELDPLHPLIGWLEGCNFMMSGHFEQAVRVLRESVQSERLPAAVWWLGLSLAYLGRAQEAAPLFDEAFKGDEGSVTRRLCRLYAHVLRNERDEAWQILRSDLHTSTAAHHDFMYAFFLAECHAQLGDIPGGLEWLERS